MKSNTTPCFPPWTHLLGPMGPRLSATVQAVSALTLTRLEERLGGYLPSALLQRPASKENSRDRVFPLPRTFWCWIWQMLHQNTACRHVVRQVQGLFAVQGGPAVDEDTGAYCQARSRLPQERLQKALRASAQSARQRAPELALLQQRPLKAVDGTGLRLADTADNQKPYPQPSNQKPGCGFPVMRLVGLFCLASGAIVAYATGSLAQPELSLFYGLFEHLQKGDIVVGDRGFGNFVTVALLSGSGVDFIGRVPTHVRRVDFRRGKRLGQDDCLMVWKRRPHRAQWMSPELWESLPQQVTVRLVRTRVTVKGFRVRHITLVTTLLDPQLYPKEELLGAYLRRWRLELGLRDLKSTLGLAELKCHTPEMVHKELLAGLVLHNLLRCVMAQAAQTQGVELDRISFKGSLDALREFSVALSQARSAKKRRHLWDLLLETLAADLVPHRPGRREPRAVKKRPKYPRLNKPRHQYVDRWSRNKRRRIARAKRNRALI